MADIDNIEKQSRILDFWFGDLKDGGVPPQELSRMWWAKNRGIDEYIRKNFENDLVSAVKGELEDWESTAHGALALIILLDQFSRNMYRDTPRAFTQDIQALSTAEKGIEKGFDNGLHPVMRVFFYMPFMHSESKDMQNRSMALFGALEKDFTSPRELAEMLSDNMEYAERHRAIIERFGRFPHRNRILGRESTTEEIEFLKQPVSSF
jgi:uncharacterized protein (DUF924 family)